MKESINIPQIFQELLGKKGKTLDIILIATFTIVSTLIVSFFFWQEFQQLKPYQSIILLFLMIDISGGVISNFTASTNNYYSSNKKLRLIFIAIHVQPLVIALVLNDYYMQCVFVWFYTIISALIVNYFVKSSSQKTIGAFLMSFGILFLLLFTNSIPVYLLILLQFYIIKLIYSFAVNHYIERNILP